MHLQFTVGNAGKTNNGNKHRMGLLSQEEYVREVVVQVVVAAVGARGMVTAHPGAEVEQHIMTPTTIHHRLVRLPLVATIV